jgi:recombination associated protein RdgC
MRELKEQVTDELLPRAFSIRRDTRVWIDTKNGWLVIDAGSQAVADEVRGLLVKSIDQLPLGTVRVSQSPVAAMTEWLLSGEGPAGFTLDQDTELRSPTEGNATVRYVGHTLDAEDMRRHIEAGKQCMRLAMTWNDRVSFVLTPSLIIKRIAPLDVLKEASDPTAQNDDERFDSDVTLMTAELDRMLCDLLDALGGEQGVEMPQAGAAFIRCKPARQDPCEAQDPDRLPPNASIYSCDDAAVHGAAMSQGAVMLHECVGVRKHDPRS